jgi:hypothetical protein
VDRHIQEHLVLVLEDSHRKEDPMSAEELWISYTAIEKRVLEGVKASIDFYTGGEYANAIVQINRIKKILEHDMVAVLLNASTYPNPNHEQVQAKLARTIFLMERYRLAVLEMKPDSGLEKVTELRQLLLALGCPEEEACSLVPWSIFNKLSQD